ncbi:MAG: phage tail tape measure protein [Candidatus Omnitrophica bacterium]|nr:phage tail tape measure protein [Candidatus Omnitrophota bacterium]
MKLIETFVYISAKDEALKAGLKNASRYARAEVSAMQRTLDSLSFKSLNFRNLVIGAASIYGAKRMIDSLIGSTVKAGDEFWDMSKRTGIATSELSALSFIAGQTGTNIEAMETGFKRLARNMYEASLGTGTAKKTFDELGISVMGQSGKLKPMTDMLMELSGAISKMDDPTKQAAYALTLMGRSGTSILPMLKEGPKAIREMTEQAKRLGLVMGTEDAKAGDELNDSLNSLTGSIEGLKRAISLGIIPVLTDYVKAATEWVVQNREMIRTKVSEWLTTIGNALKWLWDKRDTIKTVFEVAAIVIITEKIILLAGAVTMLSKAVIGLGASGGFAALMKIIAGTGLGAATMALASPVGLGVLGTLAAGGAIVIGVSEIRDHLEYINGLKLSNISEFKQDITSPTKETVAEYIKRTGSNTILTMSGYKTVEPTKEKNDEIVKITEEQEKQLANIREQYASAEIALIENKYDRERAEIQSWYKEQKTLLASNKPAMKVLEDVKYLKVQKADREEQLAGEEAMSKALQEIHERREKIRNALIENREKKEQETASNIIDLQQYIKEQTIRNTTEGFSRERELEIARYDEEIINYKNNAVLLELAAQKHWLNMAAIAKEETAQMMTDAVSFGEYWGSMLVSVVEQSGNSFANISHMFDQMLKKMVVQAAASGLMSGLFNMVTGGTGGFVTGFMAAFGKALHFASGGIVDKPTFAIIGESGPERVLNPVQTREYERGSIMPDLTINPIVSGGIVEKPTYERGFALNPVQTREYERGSIGKSVIRERVLNPVQTREYERGSVGKSVTYNDNTTLTLQITGDISKPDDIQKVANAVDRIFRERKSKEFENFKRKVVNG